MSDPTETPKRYPDESKPVVIKGVPVGEQAERLVRVRREIIRAEEMTRLEQIEAEARKKADAILSEAQRQADEILGKARSEADSIRRNAREDGDLTAKREALEKLAGLILQLETEIGRLQAARSDFLRSNLPGVIDFACALARKVLVSELGTRPEAIAERARALLERMPPGRSVTLIASPDDIEVIKSYLHETGASADAIMPSLRSDPGMSSGDMRLESDSGMIDSRLLNVLEEFGDLLTEQAGHLANQSGASVEEENGH